MGGLICGWIASITVATRFLRALQVLNSDLQQLCMGTHLTGTADVRIRYGWPLRRIVTAGGLAYCKLGIFGGTNADAARISITSSLSSVP